MVKAFATNRVYGKVTVNPVNNVVKVNRYREEERDKGESNQSFSDFLYEEMQTKQVKAEKKEPEKLRLMGGLNQYDCHAREFCFLLSTEADYKV